MGALTTPPLLFWGSPTLHRGGQNHKWPINGRIGYITRAVGVEAPMLPSTEQNQKRPIDGQMGYISPSV